ncbi:MAG TPA: hypothetical protein VGN14_14420 [Candidatus Elarobacter sp.]
MAQLVAVQDTGARYADIGDGLFHQVPDPDTAASLGLDWNNPTTVYGSADGLPGSIGDPIADVDAPAPPSAPAAVGFDTGAQYIVDGGDVYSWDVNSGTWRHIPDVATANAMGLDWNTLVATSTIPTPTGPDWPTIAAPAPPTPVPTPAPSSTPAPASSFVWGGITWTAGQLTAFVGYLAAHGADYTSWANDHPDAAAIFQNDTYPGGEEPLPKSVGEALGMAIANGATAAEAAAQAAALAASQAAQGFGAPTGDQLLQAAQDVASAYAATAPPANGGGGETPPPPSTPSAGSGAPERGLLSATPTIASSTAYTPKGVVKHWKTLVQFFATGVPKHKSNVEAIVTSIKGAV